MRSGLFGRTLLLSAALLVAAGAWFTTEVVRTLRRTEPAPLELGRVASLRLSSATRDRLQRLDGELLATYYVTQRADMPSELRRLEAQVRTVLEGLERASGGSFRYSVIDPARHPELAEYIANEGVVPQRMRTVRHDAWSEREVYSTLVLSYAGRPKTRIEGLRPEHALELQRLICAHLDELEAPRRPVVVVAGPQTDQLVRSLGLLDAAEVRRIDLDGQASIPADADVLFWISPSTTSPEHVRQLRLFLDAGGSAVIAGSTLRLELDRSTPSATRVKRLEDEDSVALLLAEFGLEAAPGALFDVFSMNLRLRGEDELPAPWRVLSIAPNQDFRGMSRQPGGTLLFDTPTAWRYDPKQLEEQGYDARTIASSSKESWINSLDEPLRLELSELQEGRAVAKQALAVWLRPRDPWRGSLVAFGSAAPFQDENFQREEYNHRLLAPLLRDTLGSPERRIIRRAGLRSAEPLPALDPGARIALRIACVLVWPLVLGLVLLLARRTTRTSSGASVETLARGRRSRTRLPRAVSALLASSALLAMLFASLWPRLHSLPLLEGARADWTRGQVHTLGAPTARLCRTFDRPVSAELVFSNPLPPELRAGLFQLEGKLADLRSAGLDLSWRTIAAQDLNETERADLALRGVEPLRITSRGEQAQSVRTIYAHAILRSASADAGAPGPDTQNQPGIRGATTEIVLDFPTAIAFDNLEFRLAATLWQLREGRPPRVALATAVPRLTPAEAHIEYQTRGLFAPSGSDPYQVLREALRLAGFEVLTIDAADPLAEQLSTGESALTLSDDVQLDLLVWLQPQRPISPMLAALTQHLRRGRNALVAAQHYEVQTRKTDGKSGQSDDSGADSGLAHWPKPEFCDLESGWFAGLGAPLVREILFDTVYGERTVEASLKGGGEERELAREETAQPFLIRAVEAGFDAESMIVGQLGDVLFAGANRFRLDPVRLSQHGLEVRVLARSSPQAWSYAWSGGNLPPGVLLGARQAASVEPEATDIALSSEPLAIELAGIFPPFVTGNQQDASALFGPDLAQPARLIAVGSSALFQNELLSQTTYDNLSFALNAIADLAMGPELGAVMANRQVAPSFTPPGEDARLLLRATTVAGVPLVLLVLGLVSLARRARSRPRNRPATEQRR